MKAHRSAEPSLRILYIHGTKVPPPKDQKRDRFLLLSGSLSGDVIQPIWFRNRQEIDEELGPGAGDIYRCGDFHYHWLLETSQSLLMEWFRRVLFFVFTPIKLQRMNRYDCIVVYSHMTTGLCASLVSLLLRVPLVVEIATSPGLANVGEQSRMGYKSHVRKLLSDMCLHLTLWSSSVTHILAPDLLSEYPLLRKVPVRVFHDFVPISHVPSPSRRHETRIIFVGSPWYLKGVDLLIQAFTQLENEFPEVRLQLLGHFPDRHNLEIMINNSKQIDILSPRPNPEVLQLISQSSLLVLPSRCEGMGRVLLEAMAAGIPVVGSDVGGIPYVIRHGVNGLVFPAEDIEALAVCLRTLLADPEMRSRMGAAGKQIAESEFSEQAYRKHFVEMIQLATRGTL